MRHLMAAVFLGMLLIGCSQVQPIHSTSSPAAPISRDRAIAIALNEASHGGPEIEVIQTHPNVLDAQLTTLAKAVEISDPSTQGGTGQDDPNQLVWLVSVEGRWQDAAPIPDATSTPVRVIFDRGNIVINAGTGEVMRSHLYPSPSNHETPGGSPAISPDRTDSSLQPAQLRVTNTSAVTLHNLVVIFPNERIHFGDVGGETTTDYHTFQQGVYRYAAYSVEINGQHYDQPVVDWIGEKPIEGIKFTYLLEVDPSHWTTDGWIIRLVKVIADPNAPATATSPEIQGTGETTRSTAFPLPKARIVFEANTDLFSIHPDGTGLTQLTHDKYALSPACSPDGKWIAYTSIRDQNYDVYLVHSDGSGETRLTQDPHEDADPAWSPDSNFLLFTSTRNGKPQIFRMRRDGSGVTQLTDLPAGVYGPKWSPDGKEIGFGSSSEVYVINQDGTGIRQISRDFVYAGYPAWSPESTRLAFYASTVDSDSEIYVVNRDGSGLYRLTDHERDGLARSYSPSWSPEGGWIAFYAQQAGGGNWTIQIIPALSMPAAKDSKKPLSLPMTEATLNASNPCWMLDPL